MDVFLVFWIVHWEAVFSWCKTQPLWAQPCFCSFTHCLRCSRTTFWCHLTSPVSKSTVLRWTCVSIRRLLCSNALVVCVWCWLCRLVMRRCVWVPALESCRQCWCSCAAPARVSSLRAAAQALRLVQRLPLAGRPTGPCAFFPCHHSTEVANTF